MRARDAPIGMIEEAPAKGCSAIGAAAAARRVAGTFACSKRGLQLSPHPQLNLGRFQSSDCVPRGLLRASARATASQTFTN